MKNGRFTKVRQHHHPSVSCHCSPEVRKETPHTNPLLATPVVPELHTLVSPIHVLTWNDYCTSFWPKTWSSPQPNQRFWYLNLTKLTGSMFPEQQAVQQMDFWSNGTFLWLLRCRNNWLSETMGSVLTIQQAKICDCWQLTMTIDNVVIVFTVFLLHCWIIKRSLTLKLQLLMFWRPVFCS